MNSRRRRTRSIARLLLALFAVMAAGTLLAPRPSSGADGEAGKDGPVVSSISFQVASPYVVSYQEMASLITLRPGDVFTGEAVRASIRGLYAKSVFKQVTAYAREADGKIDLLFHLRPSPVITEIEATGQKRVGAAQIVSASRVRRGAPLEERDLSGAGEAVRQMLRKKGFLSATVSVAALCNVENGTGKVRIEVAEGFPAVVREFAFPGAAFFSREALSEMLGVKAGEPFDFRKWEAGIGKLRREYKKAGFLAVHLSEPEIACEQGEGLCLSAAVEEGIRYDLQWEGVKKFSVSKVAKASGIYGDEEATEGGLVHDIRERLQAFYRERYYLRADAEVTVLPKGEGSRILRIEVTEGMEEYLKEVRFRGNAHLPDKQLKKQMTTEERGFFYRFTGSGKFQEEDWIADLDAIIGLYQKEGYVRARIASVDNAWDASGGMTRTIAIEEGPRYRLREIAWRGNDHFLRNELLALIGNREGGYVDYVGLERDQEAVAERYRNLGYLDSRVQGKLTFDEGQDNTVSVRFDVEEGPRYRRGKVVVRGNYLTDPVVVLREVTIPEAAPAGEGDLLKFQQGVYATGLYKSVRLQRVKRPQEGIVDLVVEVEETLFFEIEFGAGYGTDTGIRGFVGAKNRNLNGKGRRYGARVSASQQEQKFLADLREPWILGNRWKWEGGLTGAYQETVEESFSLRKASINASINKTIFERSTLSLQYELSREDSFDVRPGAVLSPEDQGQVNIALVRAVYVLDFRDDPFNPKKGSFNQGQVDLASIVLGSEVDYILLAGQTSWYFPVLRRNTFAASLRGGVIHALGDTPEVPIQKRFFLGGRTTVRGFSEKTLGPRGLDGAPIGGTYMVNGNLELRVPLQYGLLVAIFLDTGSVWFRKDPVNGFDLRETAGLGLRYVTPIGPVGLDYGWKLDRRDGESAAEWHFTIGAVF